jgi:hypothetical protein
MIARFALLLVAALALPASMARAVEPAVRCEAEKNRIAGQYLSCRHKAVAAALKRAANPDFSRCETTFARKWTAIEARTGAACPTIGDAAAMRAMFDQMTTASANLLAGPGGPGLLFAGRRWLVKQSTTPVGPGPNRFSGRPEDVRVDADGLHLTVSFRDGAWWSTEVILDENLGYGTYVFHTDSRVDLLDANIILGLFTWDDLAPPYYREIDFEFARWGNPDDPTNAQYVVQPWDGPGNLVRFRVDLAEQDRKLTSVLGWSPGQVAMATYHGHLLPEALASHAPIASWTNTGPNVPQPGLENVRMNLWLRWGLPPLDGQGTEVVITNFLFAP